MLINDPVFGKLKWLSDAQVWEGLAQLPGIQKHIALDVSAPKRRTPPAEYQRQGFVKFRDAWQREIEPKVMQKIWAYWKPVVDGGGMFGSIPVDAAKARRIKSPEELYRTLEPLTISIDSSQDKALPLQMRWNWDWDLMGVVVKFAGNRVRKATDFGDDS